jgi:maleylpyruvate isomerase
MNELSAVSNSHNVLNQKLEQLTDAHLAMPSRLPGWTVGHVLSHIAFNADALTNVARGLAKGEVGVMYPGGDAQRDGDIATGAKRSADSIRAHIMSSSAGFDTAWAALSPEAMNGKFSRTDGAPVAPAGEVSARRLREVEVHHHDAGLPWFSFADWSEDYVTWDLEQQLPELAARFGSPLHFADENGNDLHSGNATKPTEPIRTTRRTILAWALNRAEIPELDDLGAW